MTQTCQQRIKYANKHTEQDLTVKCNFETAFKGSLWQKKNRRGEKKINAMPHHLFAARLSICACSKTEWETVVKLLTISTKTSTTCTLKCYQSVRISILKYQHLSHILNQPNYSTGKVQSINHCLQSGKE